MRIKGTIAKNVYSFIYPTKDWKGRKLTDMGAKDFKVDTDNFYVDVARK